MKSTPRTGLEKQGGSSKLPSGRVKHVKGGDKLAAASKRAGQNKNYG